MTTGLAKTQVLGPARTEAWDLCPGKVLGRHQERLAAVYIRQSTAQQVLNHQESTRLQYGLQTRAVQLGWPEDRVLVIDDDLGKSGASAEGRAGFQRLVSEVSLDHIGIILGVEMSRLARSCKDWHQLLEICALFGTLIADLDGIYDPAQYNDRLLLGLKGTMSEAELHILKQRMYQGKLNKARRGELGFLVPVGYVRRLSGEVALDPDEQVQQVVRLIFRKFEELGTINAVLQYLVRNNVQLGHRVREGLRKGELEWRRPNRMTLQNLLKNPAFAGVYAYGRRQVNPRRKVPGRPATGLVVMPRQEWKAFIEDRLPAYISSEQYERNLARLKTNQSRAGERSAVRHGSAILAGLLVCAKCGCRMHVSYGGQGSLPRYMCNALLTNYGQAMCQSLAISGLDKAVTAQVLQAMQPAALELSLEASENLEVEREELSRLWKQRLERAAYESERAARHYHLVDPENRLVARQLEREWEQELAEQKKLEEEHHRYERSQPRGLSESEREEIRRLSEDIPALWNAPGTANAERKEIIRQVIDHIVVDVQGTSERVKLRVTWAGGLAMECEAIRPVAKLDQLSYYEALCDRVRTLAAAGSGAEDIARLLNEEGFRPPKRRETFGSQGVQDLMHRLGLYRPRYQKRRRTGLKENEWWLPDLAQEIPLPEVTLYTWLTRGWVRSRREETSNGRRWILWANDAEIENLRERRRRPAGYYTRRRWVEDNPPERQLRLENPETNSR